MKTAIDLSREMRYYNLKKEQNVTKMEQSKNKKELSWIDTMKAEGLKGTWQISQKWKIMWKNRENTKKHWGLVQEVQIINISERKNGKNRDGGAINNSKNFPKPMDIHFGIKTAHSITSTMKENRPMPIYNIMKFRNPRTKRRFHNFQEKKTFPRVRKPLIGLLNSRKLECTGQMPSNCWEKLESLLPN